MCLGYTFKENYSCNTLDLEGLHSNLNEAIKECNANDECKCIDYYALRPDDSVYRNYGGASEIIDNNSVHSWVIYIRLILNNMILIRFQVIY